MPRKFLKRWLPDKSKLDTDHKYLKVLGERIHDPNLWHLNRHSVPIAFAVGLFCAFLPIPFQMVIAAVIAVRVRANLPLSVMLVWITNPFTIPIIFYLTYRAGLILLNIQDPPLEHFVFSVDWLLTQANDIWPPLLVGSLCCGAGFAALGYTLTNLLWRMHIIQRLKERKEKRRQRNEC